MSVGHRIAITLAIVLAMLFALALYGYLIGAWEAEARVATDYPSIETPELCVRSDDDRARISQLMLDATDEALKNRIVLIYEVWMKEPNTEQPKRALTGLANALLGYKRAQVGARAWAPLVCSEI